MVLHITALLLVPHTGHVVVVIACDIRTDDIPIFNLFITQVNIENAKSSLTLTGNLKVFFPETFTPEVRKRCKFQAGCFGESVLENRCL